MFRNNTTLNQSTFASGKGTTQVKSGVIVCSQVTLQSLNSDSVDGSENGISIQTFNVMRPEPAV